MNRDSMVDLEEGVLAPTAMASPLLLLIIVVYLRLTRPNRSGTG